MFVVIFIPLLSLFDNSNKKMLTDKEIDLLQTYYGLAIRHNKGNLRDKCKIKDVLFHKGLTDEKPNHNFCPKGKESWCGWQKGKALKKKEKY